MFEKAEMSAGVAEKLSGAGALCLCWTMDRPAQKRIFILFFVIKICLSEEVKQNLTAVTGASITFPDPVKERGFLIFGRKPIASVSRSELEIEEDIYTNRLHWNNNTGLFTITGLQKNDSGVYITDSKKGTVFSRYYELNVYVMKVCLTEEVKQNLTAVTGASITFPDPVKERGFLLFGPKLTASVSRSELEIEEDIYTNRLHWNNNTGLFTITGLQKNDSGVYTIDSKKGTVFSRYYELKVYDPVALPVVTTLNVSDDRCILQCSVKKTEQTTLSWFRGEDLIVSRSSSEVLPLTVNQRDLTSEYLCVAANPADKKTVPVNLTTSCNWTSPPPTTEPPVRNKYTPVYIIIPIVLALLILLVAIIVKKKYLKKKESSLQTQDACCRFTRKP